MKNVWARVFWLVLPMMATGCQSVVTAKTPRSTLVDRFLFYPDRYPVGEWDRNDPGIEDVWFQSSSGKRLNGWFVEAKEPRAVVLCMSGNGGNITNRRYLLDLYGRRLGATVLIFDYEGYGRSEGTPSQSAILDDARSARRWLAGRTGIDEKEIVLAGTSLGGAVAVDLAAKDGARGLILENTFNSLADVTRFHFGSIASKLVSSQLDSAAKIPSYAGPLLQTHGDNDRVVPFNLGKRLFDAANEPKQFIAVPGGGHNDGPSLEYLEQLDRFLSRLGKAS